MAQEMLKTSLGPFLLHIFYVVITALLRSCVLVVYVVIKVICIVVTQFNLDTSSQQKRYTEGQKHTKRHCRRLLESWALQVVLALFRFSSLCVQIQCSKKDRKRRKKHTYAQEMGFFHSYGSGGDRGCGCVSRW